MGDKTKIEWTDATWNPLRALNLNTGRVGHFCEKVSPACDHCYAEQWNLAGRGGMGTRLPFDSESVSELAFVSDSKTLEQPLRWRRGRRVFVCSMTDLFLRHYSDQEIAAVFAVMALADHHTFQVLTKRPQRAQALLTDRDGSFRELVYGAMCAIAEAKGWDVLFDVWPLPNVGLGVTAEDQRHWWSRVTPLRHTPAAWRFVSCEPLLGEIVPDPAQMARIDQVIVGGESGRDARPMHPSWVRRIRDACQQWDVAFFFKQWGEWLPSDQGSWQELGRRTRYPWHIFADHQQHAFRIGRRKAGRLLDGRTWSEHPADSEPGQND